MRRGVPRKKKIYALQSLLITSRLDIFPRARKMLKNTPADTEVIVSPMVILAPLNSGGIQDRILCRVSILFLN
jgi:hypothetical protein